MQSFGTLWGGGGGWGVWEAIPQRYWGTTAYVMPGKQVTASL